MEAAPPTYQVATSSDYLHLVASYIPSNDLCSTSLVCSKWHAIFALHLWGNPASHFGTENDRVYVALTRFKRTLKTARLLVRSLTHTLHLPPAHAELYNGPNPGWLRDILERLPNLQSLIVRGLPFFDHSALQALKYVQPKQDLYRPTSNAVELPASNGDIPAAPRSHVPIAYGLRLLDASRCSNMTSHALAQALIRFENLLYLDLSFTYPARDTVVTDTLRRLSGLQVLKLRGVSMTDEGLEVLAKAVGRRVRSLDIRNNHITDHGVRALLSDCFMPSSAESDLQGTGTTGQLSPNLLPYLGTEMLNIFQGEDFEGYLRKVFTAGFVSRLAIEDAPVGGLTHLYISGNALTAEGASGLIRSSRLHVLDLGSVVNDAWRHPTLRGWDNGNTNLAMPGAEKLTPVLAKHGGDALTFIRIDHQVVTKESPSTHADEVVQGRAEMADTSVLIMPPGAVELPTTLAHNEAFELPSVSTPKAELAGGPVRLIGSSAMDDHQLSDSDGLVSPTKLRRGSAFAPEVVDYFSPGLETTDLLSPVSAMEDGTSTATFDGISSIMSTLSHISSTDVGGSQAVASLSRKSRTYSSLFTERAARLQAHSLHNNNLHPAMLPHVQTMMLIDVPPTSDGETVIDRLTGFIKQCAQEAWFARKQAKLDYSQPPGRKGQTAALTQSADKVFALKRLIIELAPEQSSRKNGKASARRDTLTKSVTEDRDSEALYSAAETDFSFFGDEECGLPSLEPGRSAQKMSDEKEVKFDDKFEQQTNLPSSIPLPRPNFDTVASLSAFRQVRRLAHQRNLAAGAVDPETEGYWDGIVQILRPGGCSRLDEELDYYGHRFENG